MLSHLFTVVGRRVDASGVAGVEELDLVGRADRIERQRSAAALTVALVVQIDRR